MRLLVGSLVIASLVMTARATAQPEPDVDSAAGSDAAPVKDPALAARWLAAAQQLVQKADYFASHGKPDDAKAQYGNAVIAYTKAIEAGDDVGVNYALALALDKLGSEADAYKHLKLAIAKPDVAKKAQAKLDEIAAKLGTVKLTITPDGAQVSLAGTPIGEAPMADPLVLAPGTYTLSLSAGGYQPKDVELKIEAGSESERKIDMEPVSVTGKPHIVGEPPGEPAAPGSKLSPLMPMIIGGSATVVFVAVATITGVAAISQHHAFTDPTYSPSDRKDAQSTGRLEARINDACFVGAIAAAAFTGGWYWFMYRKQAAADQPRAVSKVDLVPWVQPDAGGLVAAGSF
jgi:hypothetical protein